MDTKDLGVMIGGVAAVMGLAYARSKMSGSLAEEWEKRLYWVRDYNKGVNQFSSARDKSFEDPSQAVEFARSLKNAGVSTDSRYFVSFKDGAMITRPWDQFYLGEPSDEYLALMNAALSKGK